MKIILEDIYKIIIVIILICQNVGSVGSVQQKIKLPSPNGKLNFLGSVTERINMDI